MTGKAKSGTAIWEKTRIMAELVCLWSLRCRSFSDWLRCTYWKSGSLEHAFTFFSGSMLSGGGGILLPPLSLPPFVSHSLVGWPHRRLSGLQQPKEKFQSVPSTHSSATTFDYCRSLPGLSSSQHYYSGQHHSTISCDSCYTSETLFARCRLLLFSHKKTVLNLDADVSIHIAPLLEGIVQ